MGFVRTIIVFVYSLLMTVAIPLLKALSLCSPRLKHQLKDRPQLLELGRRIGKIRAGKKNALMILASSAGEFEQARPIIDRLTKDGDTFVHVVFWSQSGANYARKRGETISWCLAPFDTTWQWGLLFSAVSPTATIVIRHELWPGFLETAKAWGPCYLVNAVADTTAPKRFKRWAKRFTLSFFNRIFTVSEQDATNIRSLYGIAKEVVVATGDTKYDRALERAASNETSATEYRKTLADNFPGRDFVVIGSAYQPDWNLCFANADLIHSRHFIPLIVPHDVDSDNIAAAIADAKNAGLTPVRWTQMQQATPETNVIIVDVLGCLAELYSCSRAAYVGGGQHRKVHNVLEPAAYNLPIAHGPKFHNSSEAIMMQDLNTIVSSAAEFSEWVEKALEEKPQTRAFLESKAGAAKILTEQCWPNTDAQKYSQIESNA